MPKFKLLLVGDGGVGADELLRLHQNCMVDITYDATLNVFYYALVFFTSRGPIMIKVCDTVGQEAFGGLRDAYYAGGQCAIIMFHRSSRITYKNVPNWHRDLTRVCHSTVPIVLAGNMNGNEEPTVKDGSVIKNARIKNMQYYNLDTSSNPPVNVEKPFLWIARKLSGDDHLMFVVSPYEPPHGPENPQDP
jgi:GTP-binding nuclear protein Ran